MSKALHSEYTKIDLSMSAPCTEGEKVIGCTALCMAMSRDVEAREV